MLPSANYTFVLALTQTIPQGDRVYTGNTAMYIDEGTNRVPLTIHPIIGEITTDMIENPATAPDRIGLITFHYDSSELAGLTTPKLGVIVDDGTEQIIDLNPTTGNSTTTIGILDGNHNVKLRLYDDALLVGLSIPGEEDIEIVLGQNEEMNLVPLYGETLFSLTEEGGDAPFTFLIPHEVVDEAGSLANLDAVLRIEGSKIL